jgi:uncharacterized membrane protein
MEHIARGLEWVGVAVIVGAFLISVGYAIMHMGDDRPRLELYKSVRALFGRGILLGLEVLIAADLIRTVAVDPTLTSVGVLGLVVVVRTLLSFSLDI